MPLIGRKQVRSNVVTNPPVLPVPLYNGSLSWSESWSGQMPLKNGSPADKLRAEPTHQGTITYRNVGEELKDELKSVYEPESQVSFGGFKFEVSRITVARSSFSQGQRGRIHTYDVSVSLTKYLTPRQRQGIFSGTGSSIRVFGAETTFRSVDEAEAIEFGSSTFGGGGFFNNWEILSDGGSSESAPSVGYNDAEIKLDREGELSSLEIIRPAEWRNIPPVVEVTEEFSEQYKEPPENTRVLRGDTDLFVNSGQTKIYQKSVTVDGNPYQDSAEIWGFVYLYEDIHAGDGKLYSQSPGQFWRQIESKTTTHFYKKDSGITYQADVLVNPGEESVFDSAKALQPLIDPAYDDLVDLKGNIIKFKSAAFYNTESVTSGWQLNQFVRETESRNSLFPDDPYYELFKFVKIPLVQRKVRLLKPVRSIEGEEVPNPFTVNFVPYEELPVALKNKVGVRQITPDGEVAVLSVDPDFVEPMYVAVEGEGISSFAWREDPEAEINPDKKIPGTDIPLPRPRFITGQESRNETSRKLLANGRYQERVSTYSSQNPGHDNMAEQVRIRKVKGSPPSATSRVRRREMVRAEQKIHEFNDAYEVKLFVTTPRRSRRFPKGGSVSATSATTINEAKAEISLKLRQSEMQRTQSTVTLAWHYPGIRCKKNMSTDKDQNAARKVMKVGWNLDFQPDGKGGVICTSKGTTVTRGNDDKVPTTIRQERRKIEAPGEEGNDPTVEFSVLGSSGTLGTVLPPVQSRRNN